jgi:hypothetical protein
MLTGKDHDGTTHPHDVRYGHVILCSGQSNMHMPVASRSEEFFHATNGKSEAAAASDYVGKVFLNVRPPDEDHSTARFNTWVDVSPDEVFDFSALCWYTGKNLYNNLGGSLPVGLVHGSAGGSTIEFWLPPGEEDACEREAPLSCTNEHHRADSTRFQEFIEPLMPYTIGALLWDQGESDVHCKAPIGQSVNNTLHYPCLQRALVHSWRLGFESDFAFVAVQLPGYIGSCDGEGEAPYSSCVPGVFDMRLAQDPFLWPSYSQDGKSLATATYDLSCPNLVKRDQTVCPWGSVHNVEKAKIGSRAAKQLKLLLQPDANVTEGAASGPRMKHVRSTVRRTALGHGNVSANVTVRVDFEGGAEPFALRPTMNCDECCDETAQAGDFDASVDGGKTWINGTAARLVLPKSVEFDLPGATEKPTHVRFTGNRAFPQCALVNSQDLPAYPFSCQMPC